MNSSSFILEKDEYYIPFGDLQKWIKHGMRDMIERFNIKPPEGIYANFDCYYFKKRNPNRYFKKHLGFTYNGKAIRNTSDNKSKLKISTIKVHDYNKLFLFKLKHGL